MIHSEASPVLCAKNRFRFVDFDTPGKDVHDANFLRQIGRQASLIRSVCIGFQSLHDLKVHAYHARRLRFNDCYTKRLALIREKCTRTTTIEILLCGSNQSFEALFNRSPMGAEALEMLDTRLKAFPALKEIFVSIKAVVENVNRDIVC
jgi:hypothetical protein